MKKSSFRNSFQYKNFCENVGNKDHKEEEEEEEGGRRES